MVKVVDSFKALEGYHDVLVAFNQDSFNEGHGIGFYDCHHQVTSWLSGADLSFLDKDEDDEEATIELAPNSEAIEE